MLQAGKHDTEKLLFKKCYFFSLINFSFTNIKLYNIHTENTSWTHPKNPIILTNLGEPIPTSATFKDQVQKVCPMWPQVKGALVK